MPNPTQSSAPTPAIHFVLPHLRLDGEDEPVAVSIPWPANQTSLKDARAVLDDSRLLRDRLDDRYGAVRIAGQTWTVGDCQMIDGDTAATLWPDDVTVAGKDFRQPNPSPQPRKVRRLRGT
ncbi:hypothetical protein BH23CHL4_BH23CHL4_24100 [soil metagenome]